MESRASGYYWDPFQGYWGVTQGGPLPPRILNFMVDAIIRNWVGLVAENKAGPDGFGQMVADKVVLFYTDDGLIASTNTLCLQWSFDVLVSLFEQFRLIMNVAKTLVMVFQSGPISGQQYNAAYERRMTREGDPHPARKLWRVVYRECVADMDSASMNSHLHTKHGSSGQSGAIIQPLPLTLPSKYRVTLLQTAKAID